MPAYSKYGHFGDYFRATIFFHVIHNLGIYYEGRIYPENSKRSTVKNLMIHLIKRTSMQKFMACPGNLLLTLFGMTL